MGILVHTIILLSLGVVCLGQVRHHHKLVHKHRSLPPPEYDPNHPKLDKIKMAYLDMPVDHFNGSDKRTFRNKYFMNFDFFESGGPAFLYFPGEAPATDGFIQSVGGTQLTTIARNMIKHAGAAFVLEHRYFGESIPVDNAHTTAGMKYLTSQQYLADAAYFIKYANTKFNLAVNGTKWLTIGGSYSGSLSAWMRLLYPDVVVGAVSNSGPVLAVENYEDYFGTVGVNLKKQSQECFDETRAAFEHVLAHVDKYEEYQKLREELQLCHDMPPGDPHQLVTLVDILNGPFCTTSQYGGNNRGQYGAQNIPTLCDIMTNDTTVPYARRLRNLIQWSTPLDKWNCVDNSHLEQLATLREVNSGNDFLSSFSERELFKGRNYLNRMWNWLCCNEFGYFMTTTSANQPFGDYVCAHVPCQRRPAYRFVMGYAFAPLTVVCLVGNAINVAICFRKPMRKHLVANMLAVKSIANMAFMLALVPVCVHTLRRPLEGSSAHRRYLDMYPVLQAVANAFGTYGIWFVGSVSAPRRNLFLALLIIAPPAVGLNFLHATDANVETLVCYLKGEGTKPVLVYRLLLDAHSLNVQIYAWANLVFVIVGPVMLMFFATASIVWRLYIKDRPNAHRFHERKRCVTRLAIASTATHLLLEAPAAALALRWALDSSAQPLGCDLEIAQHATCVVEASLIFVVYLLAGRHRYRRLMVSLIACDRCQRVEHLSSCGLPSAEYQQQLLLMRQRREIDVQRREIMPFEDNNHDVIKAEHLPLGMAGV